MDISLLYVLLVDNLEIRDDVLLAELEYLGVVLESVKEGQQEFQGNSRKNYVLPAYFVHQFQKLAGCVTVELWMRGDVHEELKVS